MRYMLSAALPKYLSNQVSQVYITLVVGFVSVLLVLFQLGAYNIFTGLVSGLAPIV